MDDLIAGYRRFRAGFYEQNREMLERLAVRGQRPSTMIIGCSDARVDPAINFDTAPGDVFMVRNVANVVVHSDLNCLSVIQFAIDVLKVRHIMVVGHYGCGGVQAALLHQRVGHRSGLRRPSRPRRSRGQPGRGSSRWRQGRVGP